MTYYSTYTVDGTTALQVSATAVRIRGNVYDLQRPVTALLVTALVRGLNRGEV